MLGVSLGMSMRRGIPTATLRQSSRRRLSTLDGIRGVCVLVVIGAHSLALPGAGIDQQTRKYLFDAAQTSVDLFFCMSGYLITSLLPAENERTGTISFSKFYGRRALRIMPAYYAYVVAVFLLGGVGALDVPWSSTPSGADIQP